MVAMPTLRDQRTAVWYLLLIALIFLSAVPAPRGHAADEPPGENAGPASPAPEKAAPQEYYELYKLLADALDQVERNYVKEVDRRKLVEAALRGMLSELDPYSAYIDPEQLEDFRDTIEAEFGGIGAQVGVEQGQLKVISPLVGTPAYRAGLLAGDVILEIDGQSTEGFTLDEAVKRLKGEPGTQVTLTVVHPGRPGKETLTLTREIIHVETVLGDQRNADDSWDFMLDDQQRIGYVRLTAFSRDTAAQLQGVIEQLRLQGLRALILDLRFNPGGLLRSAIEISDMFVAEGTIVSTEGRNSPQRTWKAHRPGTYGDFPMVVLVNRYSASASEIVAACLQDHQRAVIVGERTWGKGSVQNLIELEEGRSALKLTTAAYQRPSGKNIHRFPDDTDDDPWGVTPDEGFELRLGDSEIVGLMRDRRQRDIVRPQPTSAQPPAEPAVAENQPDGQAAGNGEAAPASEPAGSQPPASGEEAPSGGESSPPAPSAPPEEAGQKEAETAPPAFVDRQLEMALNYLWTELARAEAAAKPAAQD